MPLYLSARYGDDVPCQPDAEMIHHVSLIQPCRSDIEVMEVATGSITFYYVSQVSRLARHAFTRSLGSAPGNVGQICMFI